MQSIALKLGTQPELPDWVYTGAILGVQGGTQVVRYFVFYEFDFIDGV